MPNSYERSSLARFAAANAATAAALFGAPELGYVSLAELSTVRALGGTASR